MSNSKRPIEDDEDESNNSLDESDSDEEMGQEEELGENDREIQVDFEGQNPSVEDVPGIKNLLRQLFLKAHVNLTGLAELLAAQNFVGSVLKQCLESDEASDEEDNTVDDVFGITSVLNLSQHKDVECVKDVIKYLVDKSQKKLEGLLQDSSNNVGLLINERFINIPPQVSLPLLENLSKEIEEAKRSKKPFNFTHFILISKLHESTRKDAEARKKKAKGGENIFWVNAEEEPISDLGETVTEFSVRSESDCAVSGTWGEDDDQLDPKRRIIVLPASQLSQVLIKVKEFLS
nr:EOG090X0C3Y [Ilyocryptus agilis]